MDTAPIIYAADVTPLQDAKLYELAYALASPSRREKTDRYYREKDRQLSLGVETLLRYALRGESCSTDLSDFVYSAENKPYLKNSSCFFNLSHSGIWAICAVAGCEVGCDVEQIAPIDLKLARHFQPEEYEDILTQPTEDKQLRLFYRYWTLKESFMKATGLGMKLSLNAFHIVPGETVSVFQSVDDRNYSFYEYSNLPGYQCAICCAGNCTDTKLRVLDLKEILLQK